MKKTAFYSKYHISDVKPIDVTRRSVSASDFAKVTKRFLNDNFRGLCRVESEVPEHNNVYIIVSEDQITYFFKIMLSYILPDRCVDINTAIEDNQFIIKISSDTHLPFSPPDALEILKIAKRAGFWANITDESIVLYTKANLSMTFKVYATSTNKLEAKFNEIFFTGVIE